MKGHTSGFFLRKWKMFFSLCCCQFGKLVSFFVLTELATTKCTSLEGGSFVQELKVTTGEMPKVGKGNSVGDSWRERGMVGGGGDQEVGRGGGLLLVIPRAMPRGHMMPELTAPTNSLDPDQFIYLRDAPETRGLPKKT